MRARHFFQFLIVLFLVSICSAPGQSIATGGREYYVAADATPGGDGSMQRPWTLGAAFQPQRAIQPGDTVWLRGGTYGTGGTTEFVCRLVGTRAKPIIVRQYPGERAIVNGGINAQGAYTWFWGFEITNTSQERVAASTPQIPSTRAVRMPGLFIGTNPAYPQGGGHKVINMVIHDTGHPGIQYNSQGSDGEIYGSIIWGNGIYDQTFGGATAARPIPRGDAIYAQNQFGRPRIADNVLFRNFTVGAQAYAEGGFVKGYRVEGNISFENADRGLFVATLSFPRYNPIEDVVVTENYVYQTMTGRKTLALGYRGMNVDAVVTKNYLVGADSGTTANFSVTGFAKAVVTDNVSVSTAPSRGNIAQIDDARGSIVWDRNQYFGGKADPFRFNSVVNAVPTDVYLTFAGWQTMSNFDRSSTYSGGMPVRNLIAVRPNRYEPGRANIAVFNWENLPSVQVDLAGVMPVGSTFEIRDALNYLGTPVVSGTYAGGPVSIPMNLLTVAPILGTITHYEVQRHTAPRFGAFVLLSSAPSRPPAVNRGGVVGASGPGAGGEISVAPGSLISIYGTDLTRGQTAQASLLPLPAALGGVQVRIDGNLAPLYYVSPGQINAQLPPALQPGQSFDLQVVSADAASPPERVQVVDTAPGIFAVVGGSKPGEAISIYGTGLGAVSPAVDSGAESPVQPLAQTTVQPEVLIGGTAAQVLFSGLAPGFVGVNQINALIPAGLSPGRNMVELRVGGRRSNAAAITVSN